ncbi:MAG: type II toxin-antitoxin system Phd/YefM family antitoxin [Actinomycetota bacterium]
MEVAVSALRAHLKDWLDRARAGEEVVITERGVPLARLVSVDATPIIERLTRQGVISKPRRPGRLKATGRPRVAARGPVAELVTEQRR